MINFKINYLLSGDWQESHPRDANYPLVSPSGIERYVAWHQGGLKRCSDNILSRITAMSQTSNGALHIEQIKSVLLEIL